MAKHCIYCGHLLAKEDARFCNDCGQSQVLPASASADADGAAPSAIKVRLPPKEFSRSDSASPQRETSLPGISASVVSPARESTLPPSSRMPKRPVRLAPSESPAPANREEKPASDAPVPLTHLANSLPATSGPTPAEELSTMVLPNWREELAQLRREQEQASRMTTSAPEKRPERPSLEPPALPKRLASAPLAPREPEVTRPPAAQQSRPGADVGSGVRVPERMRPADFPRRLPDTPVPQEVARPAEDVQRPPASPLAPPDPAATDIARRELRVKVWQQDAPQTPRPREEPPLKPAPAVEQNPFAAAAMSGEAEEMDIEDRATLQWQTPLSPLPAGPHQSALSTEKPASRREEERTARAEGHSPVEERSPFQEELPAAGKRPGEDIEDLPTMHLAVPETVKPGSQIQIERTSTPRKRPESSADEVEDLPTRPMAASPAPAAASRPPSSPGLPPMQSGERRPDFAQGPGNPASLPGIYGGQPAARVPEIAADPQIVRGRPGGPDSQPGAILNPPSLPPIGGGPLSMPGNTPPGSMGQGTARPVTPFPDTLGQRPPQRPPSFDPALPPQSMSADTSKRGGAAEAQTPRKKKKIGSVLVACLAFVLVAGVAAWVVLYQPFTVDQSTQPYWNYQDKTLGFSVDYTAHWNINIDKAHTMARFLDNTKTGQATLVSAPASGQLADYLNQQETQLGMSGKKTATPATFASSSWQVVQGTIVQSGVTYTMVVYATQHGNHFYLLEFQAPPNVYAGEDQNSFAHMRSSFQFL